MKRRILTLALLALCLMPSTGIIAQRLDCNDVLYHSFRSPLSTRLNPALFPESSSWYVTLPRVGVGLAMPISYNDFGLRYDPRTDSTVLNVNDLLHTLDSCGSRFNLNADIDLFGFGFEAGPLKFNFASGLRFTSGFCVPLGFTQLATQGNVGSKYPIEMGCSDFFHAQAYLYTSVGAAYTLSQVPLTLGGRLNLLDGIASFSADNLSLRLTTLDNAQELRISTDYLVHTAGMVYLEKDEGGSYNIATDTVSFSNLPNPNWGYTFDLGASLQYDNFNISASLLDIGPGIHWTTHPTTIVPKHKDARLSFDGIDLSSLLTDGEVDTTFVSNLMDSLINMVDYEESATEFWSGVPTRLYLGASYNVSSMLRVGYLVHGEWDGGLFNPNSTFRCSNTLSATATLVDWIDVTVANSLTYDGFSADLFNPGIAFSLNLGKVFQIYFALDYASNIYAVDIKAARLFAGLNIVGKKRK